MDQLQCHIWPCSCLKLPSWIISQPAITFANNATALSSSSINNPADPKAFTKSRAISRLQATSRQAAHWGTQEAVIHSVLKWLPHVAYIWAEVSSFLCSIQHWTTSLLFLREVSCSIKVVDSFEYCPGLPQSVCLEDKMSFSIGHLPDFERSDSQKWPTLLNIIYVGRPWWEEPHDRASKSDWSMHTAKAKQYSKFQQQVIPRSMISVIMADSESLSVAMTFLRRFRTYSRQTSVRESGMVQISAR